MMDNDIRRIVRQIIESVINQANNNIDNNHLRDKNVIVIMILAYKLLRLLAW